MKILSKIFSNTRKPEGFFGRMIVNGMNGGGHAKLAGWGLSEVSIAEMRISSTWVAAAVPISHGCYAAPPKAG